MKYAANTDVSSDRSRAEIEKVLQKYGATQFHYGWDRNTAMVAFVMSSRMVRFHLVLPDKKSTDFTHTATRNKQRSEEDALKLWEQATRQRWRALLLVVKAKLEAVESGISTFEQEFLSFIIVPGTGKTVGELAQPQLEAGYKSGSIDLKLLPGA